VYSVRFIKFKRANLLLLTHNALSIEKQSIYFFWKKIEIDILYFSIQQYSLFLNLLHFDTQTAFIITSKQIQSVKICEEVVKGRHAKI